MRGRGNSRATARELSVTTKSGTEAYCEVRAKPSRGQTHLVELKQGEQLYLVTGGDMKNHEPGSRKISVRKFMCDDPPTPSPKGVFLTQVQDHPPPLALGDIWRPNAETAFQNG